MTDDAHVEKAQLTRREVVKKAGIGAGGLVLAGSAAGNALARPIRVTHEAVPEANSLKIGFLSPLTGPLGSFGEADPWVVSEFRKALKKGVKIGGKTYAVTIISKDTQSDPARAGQLAKSLINGSKVDLMLSTSTPEVNNPGRRRMRGGRRPAACRPCSRGKPGTSDAARSRAARTRSSGRYHFSFGAADFAAATSRSGTGRSKTNKKVGVLYPNDADGNAIRAALVPAAREGRLHDRRPRALRGRHDRLLRADREVQAGELPDLQHLPDPARLRHLLAPGRAAGATRSR